MFKKKRIKGNSTTSNVILLQRLLVSFGRGDKCKEGQFALVKLGRTLGGGSQSLQFEAS